MKEHLKNCAIILLLIALGFAGGYYVTSNYYTDNHDKNLESIIYEWKTIKSKSIYSESIDFRELADTICSTIVYSIGDSHAYYFNPAALAEDEENTNGQYGGIGCVSQEQDGKMVLIEVYPDNPAAKAGLRVGDVILEVDGVKVTKDTISMVRGEIGTKVSIRVLRNKEILDFTIPRAAIYVPSVTYELIDDVEYIRIKQFNNNTTIFLRNAIEDAEANEAIGLVIDLRGNPGGLLDTLVECAAYFLEEGQIILHSEAYDGNVAYVAGKYDCHTDLPIVILINQGSASAAEAFTGALKDNQRAVIAGQKSYGKGTMNVTFEMPNGSAFYLSIGQWQTPNGVNIEKNGITPDYELSDDTDWVLWAIEKIHSEEK